MIRIPPDGDPLGRSDRRRAGHEPGCLQPDPGRLQTPGGASGGGFWGRVSTKLSRQPGRLIGRLAAVVTVILGPFVMILVGYRIIELTDLQSCETGTLLWVSVASLLGNQPNSSITLSKFRSIANLADTSHCALFRDHTSPSSKGLDRHIVAIHVEPLLDQLALSGDSLWRRFRLAVASYLFTGSSLRGLVLRHPKIHANITGLMPGACSK